MSPGVIVFIVLYVVALIAYFITETSGKMKLRAPNKILLAVGFFTFAVITFSLSNKFNFMTYQSLLIAALFLAMLGDIFLLFNFNRGGDFFLCGNIVFFMFELFLMQSYGVHADKFWWIFLVVPILWTTWLILFKKFPNFFKVGKMMFPMLLYLSTIILHGVTGIAVAANLGSISPAFICLGLGSFLFMLSDFDIVFHNFVCPKNKWVLRLNSALYFVGMLLIVLSIPLL